MVGRMLVKVNQPTVRARTGAAERAAHAACCTACHGVTANGPPAASSGSAEPAVSRRLAARTEHPAAPSCRSALFPTSSRGHSRLGPSSQDGEIPGRFLRGDPSLKRYPTGTGNRQTVAVRH
jgi:hypothetical protein